MGTISRVTTWSTGDTLTAADLNGEFDNILSTANGSLNADNLGVTAGIASALKAVVLDSNKDFADGTGSNQIRNLTISGSLAIGTTFLPDAAGGADLGSATLEWGDVYVADDKYLYMGSDQNIKIGYDETTTDSLAISAIEGAALAITLRADEGDDAGDEWKLNVADGGTITLGNDIASAGTFVTHLTLTPHATVASSTLSLAGGLTVAGATQANGTVTVGADDQGYDVKLFGDTASAYLLWDTSADKLLTAGGATIDIVKDKLLIGSTAVTTTAAELNVLDAVSAGTVAASLAVVVDSNKDIGSFRNVTLTGELDAATGDFSGDVDVDGTLEADAITIGGTGIGSIYGVVAGSTSIVTVGTVGTGTWQATKVASAYLDDDTAHLTTTQTFSGAKTFSAAAQFSNTVTVGVDGTGYDVQFFGDTSGSSVLWDQSADDLILTNAGLAVGSDATGDVYYRDANGFLARLGVGSDGQVLTSTGTLPNWEAAPGAGSGDFSGPGSATDNAVVRFDGTGGKTGQNSGLNVDDSNNVTGAANVTLSGELDAATGDFSGDVDVDGTLETDALTIDGTAILANDTNNRVTTATGSGTFNGEAELTFDGTDLAIGNAAPSSYIESVHGLVIGDTSDATSEIVLATSTSGTSALNFTDQTFSYHNLGYLRWHNASTNHMELGIQQGTHTFFMPGPYAVMGGTTQTNANMTIGWTINQTTNDNEIISLKSSDIAHGRTSVTETDTYASFAKSNGDYGGLLINAMGEDAALSTVFQLTSYGGTASTTKTTAGVGLINFTVNEHDGSNNPANVTSNGNVFTIQARRDSGGSPAFLNCILVDEDGDLYSVTSAQTFDSHDDIALVNSYDGIRSDMADFNKGHEAELIRLGVLGAPIAEGGMTNVTQLQRLHNGAIRQLHQKVETVKEFYEDKIAALESRLMALEA